MALSQKARQLLSHLPLWVIRMLKNMKMRGYENHLVAIEDLYEQDLDEGEMDRFPPVTSRIVVAMIGLPDSGKTTAAEKFAQAIDAYRVDTNKIRNWLHQKRLPYTHDNAIAFHYLEERLSLGFSVVMDADFADPLKRRMLESVVAKYDKAHLMTVQVKVDSVTWYKRLDVVGKAFGKLYGDAVKNQDPRLTGARECLRGEFQRQQPNHNASISFRSADISIPNDGPMEIFYGGINFQIRRLLRRFAVNGSH